LRRADAVLAVDDNDSAARLIRAAALTGLRRYAEARRDTNALARAFPSSPQVRMQQGLLALAENRPKDAERIFSELFQATGDVRTAAGLLEVYSTEKQFDTAVRFIGDALAKSPDSVALKRLLAAASARAGDFDQSVRQYQMLVQQNPESLDLRLRLGDAYRAKGDYAHAIDQFQAAVKIEPSNANARLLLAETLNIRGDLVQSREQYQEILKAHPGNPVAMNNVAYLMSETGGDLRHAFQLAEGAVRKEPQRSDFADTLGIIYLKQGNNAAALQIFDRLVREDPKHPTYRLHAAMALIASGDKGRAKQHLKAALTHPLTRDDESRINTLLRELI
jgi:tetratricopeptide (TPR) repeat protein